MVAVPGDGAIIARYRPASGIRCPMVVFPPVAGGEQVDISATTFATYQQCPERAAGRLRGEYGPDSRASFVGGLGHRVFARHLSSGPIAADEFAQVCREEIGAAMNPKMTSLGIRPSDLAAVIGEVGSLYERFKLLGFAGFEGVEVELEATPLPDVRLHGKVDAVFEEDGRVRLVDWKTGTIGDDADAQLEFYALLWALARGRLPDRVDAVSVKTGQRSEAAPTDTSAAATAVNVAEMVGVLRQAWREGTDLERRGGPRCRYCPLLDDCAEGQAAQRVLAVGLP